METATGRTVTAGWPVAGPAAVTFWILTALYFSHWVGIGLSSIAVLMIFIAALARKSFSGKIRRETVVLVSFIAAYSLLTLLLQWPAASEFTGWSPTKTPRLLLQAVSPLLVFALISMLPRFTRAQLGKFLSASYWIFAVTIAGEWLLVNVAGVSPTSMPAFREAMTSYLRFESYYRPFGLTGNPSVNGCLLVIAAWLLIFEGFTRSAGKYLIVTGIVLYLNNSGQALVAFLLLVMVYLQRRNRGLAKLFVLAIAASIFVYVIRSGVISKISYDYIVGLFRFLGLNNFSQMDRTSLVLGGYGRYSQVFESLSFTTEFYPIYTITRLGALITIATWWFIYKRLPRPRLMFFLLLLLASVHYPTILFVEMEVLVGVVIVGVAGEASAVAPIRASALPTA